jgi:release factor glutamine methyltransferase
VTTVAEALAATRVALEGAGIPDAAFDARLLLAEASGLEAAGLLSRSRDPLAPEAETRLATLVERRLRREPVGRIRGRREFWGLSFALSPETLEPRADTETLVEAALATVADRSAPLRMLDLGTGTGCILVALLAELPQATGIGIDLSPGAARVARDNAIANGVGARASFVCGSWADAIDGRFDLVVSNPPYIPAGEIGGLAPEVARFDPARALDGGADGLVAYRALLGAIPRLLAPGGTALLEIGHDQAAAVSALASTSDLAVLAVHRDLSEHDRVVSLERKSSRTTEKASAI